MKEEKPISSQRQKINSLKLIGSFIQDLYTCAVEPTEEKIAEFHSRYGRKIAEIKEAVPFKTWGDQQILHDGIAILEKIGNGATLSEVAADMKRVAIDSFRKDLTNLVTDPTAPNIADFSNDYNDKLENIRTLTGDAKLLESLEKINLILKDCYNSCQFGAQNVTASAYRCFKLIIEKGDGLLFFVEPIEVYARYMGDLKPHIDAIRSHLGLEVPQEKRATEASASQGQPSSFVETIRNTEAPEAQQGVAAEASASQGQPNSFAEMEEQRQDADRNGGCRIM